MIKLYQFIVENCNRNRVSQCENRIDVCRILFDVIVDVDFNPLRKKNLINFFSLIFKLSFNFCYVISRIMYWIRYFDWKLSEIKFIILWSMITDHQHMFQNNVKQTVKIEIDIMFVAQSSANLVACLMYFKYIEYFFV